MAGKINRMINSIIEQKSRGNPTLAMTTRTKLIIKGVNPAKFTQTSPDDELVIQKLFQIAQEMGVNPMA
jgi:hypothetical protein